MTARPTWQVAQGLLLAEIMGSEQRIVRFGVFEVDLRAGELRRQGLKVKLQEKPFQVLARLLEHPGEVVTREELRERLWPEDTFVDFDHSLNIAVAKLREALGDSAETPRFVETLPRRGHRFIYPVEATGGTSPVPGSWPGRRRITALALVLLAAVLGGGSLYFFRGQRTQALGESDQVLLADVTNTTRDPVFDDTLKQALAIKLEESPFLNVVPQRKVQETLRSMNRAADVRVTDAVALEVCQRQNTTALLESSIASLGRQYVITLHAVNCRTGDSLGREQAEADGKETVLEAVGQAASRLRAKLGESLSSIEEFDTPIQEATTSSLEALKAYSLGRKTHRTIGDAEAIPFYERAIELDPEFAMAYATLAVSNANLGQASLAGAYARRAFELHDRVSEREKFRVAAAYYGLAQGDFETENQTYRLWTQSYPRDAVPHANLADNYQCLGQYERGLTESLHALRLEPHNGILQAGLAQNYLALNRFDEARAAVEQARVLQLDNAGLHLVLYFLAFLEGDQATMEQQVAWGAGERGEGDWILSTQSDTEAYYGRLGQARDFSRRAVDSARRANALETAARWEVNAALREAEFGYAARARQGAAAAMALAPGRDTRVLAALAVARAGDAGRARALVQELEREFPSSTLLKLYWLPTIRAALALHRGDATRAVEYLQATIPYELGGRPQLPLGTLYPVFARGQAYLLAGNGGEAAAEFQKILYHRGIVLNFPLGALAHLGLARARTLQGDAAGARTAYQDFLTLWKDADPDIPILQQAKSEHAKLEAGAFQGVSAGGGPTK